MYRTSTLAMGPLPKLFPALKFFIAAWAAYSQRRDLALLDSAALRDIGLTKAEAAHECAKPFWDVPAHWVHC